MREYWEVLLRPRFPFDPEDVQRLLEKVEADGVPVLCDPLPADLPDKDDNMFVEAALAGGARCLVTGNLKHYPPERCCGIEVVTPVALVTWPDFP